MKISSLEHSIFTHGRIQIVTPEEAGEPVQFAISRHSHEAATGAQPPQLAEHEIGDEIRRKTGQDALQSIPVRVIFDKAEHNVMARYEAWSDLVEDVPVCIGDGESANLLNPGTGVRQAHVCKGPQLCNMALANGLRCAIAVRMPVVIGDKRFELRSSSTHTYRALIGQLREMQAKYGGLRQLHLELTVWEKSLRASDYKRFGCAAVELSKDSPDPGAVLSPCPDLEQYGESLLQAWRAETIPTAMEMQAEEKVVLAMPQKRSSCTPVQFTGSSEADDATKALFQAPFLASQEQGAAQMI